MQDPWSAPCNVFDSIYRNTRGGLVHHLVLLILPPVLYLVPAVLGSLFNQELVPYL